MHTMTIPVTVEDNEVKVDVTYTYTPGSPAFIPRGEYAPIEPPEPPEVDLITMEVEGAVVPKWFATACEESILEHIHDHHEDGPDPDAAYDQMRDEA